MPLDQYGGENGMVGYEDTYSPGAAGRRREDRRSAAASAGAGAASGAATGAAAGSAFGPWGTLIGAAIGTVGGAIGGGIKGRRQNKRQREKERAWNEAQKKLAQERYQARVHAHNLAKLALSPVNGLMQEMYGQDSGFDLNQTPWGPAQPTRSGPAPSAWSPSQYGGARSGPSYWEKPSGDSTPKGDEAQNRKKPEGKGKGSAEKRPNAR